MAAFEEVLERIQVQKDEVNHLFVANATEGSAVRTIGKNVNPEYKRNLAAAAKFIAEVYSGYRNIWQLQEVMTTSDFPQLFGDILDRSVLAAYQEWPAPWTSYAKRVLLNDFRSAKIFPPIWGADGPLDPVKEAAPYPNVPLHEQTPLTWSLQKYGRQVPFSWESMINDDLDQLKDIPERLGRAARRTEDWNVSQLFIGNAGPLASFYSNTNGNIINTTNGAQANNPALSITGLQDAYTVLSRMKDENGQPIMRENVVLVVPPALEVVALNILNATELWVSDAKGGGYPGNGTTVGSQTLVTQNWMRNRLRIVVNPYIPMIASSNQDTSWFLFADPNYSREAFRIGFLRGHETPEIWMKTPNATRVGGGAVDAMSGDFATDTIQYRVRHVVGLATIDPKASVASNGSGS